MQIPLLLVVVLVLVTVVLLPLLEVPLHHFVLEVGLLLAELFVLVTVLLLLERWHWWVPLPLLDPWLVVVLAVLVDVADLVAVLAVVDLLAVSLHAAVLVALAAHSGLLCWLLFTFAAGWMLCCAEEACGISCSTRLSFNEI
jgi:hypothetical protein